MPNKYTMGLPPATRKDEVVALDFEIFEQDMERAHIPNGKFACLSCTTSAGNFLVTDQADVRRMIERVGKSTLAMQHASYDLRYFRKFGVDIRKLRVWDTEVAGHVQYSGYYKGFSLADLARRELDLYLDKTIREGFSVAHEMSLREKQYAVDDSVVTHKIALRQIEDMTEDERKIYWNIEYPASMAILELAPIRVNRGLWMELAKTYEAEFLRLKGELGFNPRSPDQVKKVLAGLGISLESTAAEFLEPHRNFEIVDAIIRAREAATNFSTYGEKWLAAVNGDGLVEGDWVNCGTETDRWACKKPNLQNVPVRKAPRYRHAFEAPEKGWVIVSTDANSQEPRCMYYMCRDPNYLAALLSPIKVHLVTTRKVFHDDTITKSDPRYRKGKDAHLGTLFGLSEYGLANRYQMPVEEAKGIIDGFFIEYPGIKRWMDQTRASADRLGFVRGATGMVGWLNPHTKQSRRNAINWPIQNTAAHITKRATALLWEMTQARGLPFGLTMVVHDEQVVACPKKLAKTYKKLTNDAWMEAAAEVIPGTPFATETYIGPTWGKEEE